MGFDIDAEDTIRQQEREPKKLIFQPYPNRGGYFLWCRQAVSTIEKFEKTNFKDAISQKFHLLNYPGEFSNMRSTVVTVITIYTVAVTNARFCNTILWHFVLKNLVKCYIIILPIILR